MAWTNRGTLTEASCGLLYRTRRRDGSRELYLSQQIAGRTIREQAVRFALDHGVALADPRFQFRTIQPRYLAAAVPDQPISLKLSPAASVSPSRRTPSMFAINSWVMVSSKYDAC